jgi:hypothetical protein
MRGYSMIRVVELFAEFGQLRFRRGSQIQHAAHIGASGYPCRATQEFGARIAPGLARGHVHVAPAQPVWQALQNAKSIEPSVDFVIGLNHQLFPGSTQYFGGRFVHGGLRLALHPSQEVERSQHGLSGGASFELNTPQQSWQKATHGAVVAQQVIVVFAVVLGPAQLAHRVHTPLQLASGEQFENTGTHFVIWTSRIQNNLTNAAHPECRGIEVLHGWSRCCSPWLTARARHCVINWLSKSMESS